MSNLILAVGGSRSGKSSFAEQVAWTIGGYEVIYLATAQALDKEMEERIAKHRCSRPNRWLTVEEPVNLRETINGLDGKGKAILLDCLTLWVSNLMGAGLTEVDILAQVQDLAEACARASVPVVVVSNELGMGLVPTTPLGREYRDVIGRANQIFAAAAREVFFVVAGIPVELKALSRGTIPTKYLETRVPQEALDNEL